MKKKSPQSGLSNSGVVRVADMIPQLITRFGLQRRQNLEQIIQAWKVVVGEPFDSVTNAVELKRGVLTIAVKHNAFVQELSFRQAELLESMQSKITNEKIKKIKWIVEN
ncbi:MAG: DUF721 domain-containing protein [Planctomycetaceae bacterium]|jgi:predicted nucleic acid-binding Zn ribbon protein|nr:DUF721 domain-containing protein [Planctomycetaceae bacterium]